VFSGLVSAQGDIRANRARGGGVRLEVSCRLGGEPLARGESIAMSGACLTVETPTASGFTADVSPETVARTTLAGLRPGAHVNLERALRLGDRLGGHLVTGHVDAVAEVMAVRRQGSFRFLRVRLPAAHAREVVEKGSVAVDGVSLTVSALAEGSFEVALVPATLATTTLSELLPGSRVNLETDVLAKYVRRALGTDRGALDLLWEGFGRAES
jgi:riboflavin synthase